MHFKINNNGNTAEDMLAKLKAAKAAAKALQEALRDVNADVVHGRNYQTLEAPVNAYSRDAYFMRQYREEVAAMINWLDTALIEVASQSR